MLGFVCMGKIIILIISLFGYIFLSTAEIDILDCVCVSFYMKQRDCRELKTSLVECLYLCVCERYRETCVCVMQRGGVLNGHIHPLGCVSLQPHKEATAS